MLSPSLCFFYFTPIPSGCTAVTFGLLAVDIFTTTGARINELLQISNTTECIKAVKSDGKIHYSFYAIPKGRDTVEPFYISEQTMKLILRTGKLLKEHYRDNKIPSVQYKSERSHLFPEPKPYFFQYKHSAFRNNCVYGSLRFLLHGLDFENTEWPTSYS